MLYLSFKIQKNIPFSILFIFLFPVEWMHLVGYGIWEQVDVLCSWRDISSRFWMLTSPQMGEFLFILEANAKNCNVDYFTIVDVMTFALHLCEVWTSL